MYSVNDAVRTRALAAGAGRWLDELPALIAELEDEWAVAVGRRYENGTESFVAQVTCDDGSAAVLKLLIPRFQQAHNEITVLRLAGGQGCAQLLRADERRGALLLERLGRSLGELAVPAARQHEIFCAAVTQLWRPAPDCGLPTGAEKGRELIDAVAVKWDELGRPCTERAVAHALACADLRTKAHDDERAVLVHADVHPWNTLEAPCGFKLVDAEGLLAEAEFDLGVIMREHPVELLRVIRMSAHDGLPCAAD